MVSSSTFQLHKPLKKSGVNKNLFFFFSFHGYFVVYTEFKHIPLVVSVLLVMVGEFNERVATIVELFT